jgi:hypothetical protein
MELSGIGRWLILIGFGIAGLGGLLWLISKVPLLNQLGNLPGDIRIMSQDGRFGCFLPIASSILLSILLTVVLNIVVRLMNR